MAFYPRPNVWPKRIVFPIRRPSDIPFLAQKLPSVLPSLPSPPRDSNFLPGYTVTTHLVPSASPRLSVLQRNYFGNQFPSYQAISPTIPPEEEKTKESRLAWAKRTGEALIHQRKVIGDAMWEGKLSSTPSDFSEEDFGPLLWNVVNRYARVREQKSKRDIGITVVVAHANGMHKETWEPTIKHLIELSDNPKTGIYVDEIWSIEAVNHGDSALLNEGKFLDGFDWFDNARDILSFVENYIPDGPYVADRTLPTHLERVSTSVARERRTHGIANRNIVGIGHSLGGCSIANAACGNPHLFHSITLVDPIIYDQPREWYTRLTYSALSRRQRWGSREEAFTLFKKSSFFRVWEPEVLDLYLKYALTDIPPEQGGGVRLKMSGFDEATIFANPYVPIETAQLIESLDTDVKLRWVMAGKDIEPERADIMQEMVWRRITNSSNVIVDAGHLIAQEAPYQLAKETVYGWRVLYAEKQDPVWNRL